MVYPDHLMLLLANLLKSRAHTHMVSYIIRTQIKAHVHREIIVSKAITTGAEDSPNGR